MPYQNQLFVHYKVQALFLCLILEYMDHYNEISKNCYHNIGNYLSFLYNLILYVVVSALVSVYREFHFQIVVFLFLFFLFVFLS